MRKCSQWLMACGLIGLGYFLGTSGFVGSMSAIAQDAAADKAAAATQPGALSEEVQKKITAAFEAVKAAREALEAENLYLPATTSTNTFGILSGGLNAIEDLETGRGVDPETFAALYADMATEEVKSKLTKDDKGRLVYNGKLVQMYPISRLRKTFDARAALSGEKPAASSAPAKKSAAEKTEEPAEEKTEEKKEE